MVSPLPASVFLNRKTPPRLLTLTLLTGLSALTLNLMLPSLPQMALYFNAPYGLMQLAVSLYLALLAVVQVVIGPVRVAKLTVPKILAVRLIAPKVRVRPVAVLLTPELPAPKARSVRVRLAAVLP